MAIPVTYNLRNLVVRKTTTIMTALGVALTVAVLLSILALVNGLRTAFQASGNPLNVMVLRKGSSSELTSGITPTVYQDLKSNPGIARDAAGRPLASLEMVTVTVLKSVENPAGSNTTVRAIPQEGIALRDVKLADGRWFQPGLREIVVGKNLAKRYSAARVGKQLRFGKGSWTIVGVMDGGATALDSEIWGDSNQISSDYNRQNGRNVVMLRAVDATTMPALINSLNDDQRLNVEARSETEYWTAQTSAAAPIQFLGIFISIVMAVGSSFAAMNTMYAAVSRRSQEIGTLRVLGFSRGSILLSFFLESLLLSVLGGIIGCILVLPLNNITTGVGSFTTFSEFSFNFRVSPEIMAIGVGFALIMGAIGGLFPARMAANKEILVALREA